MPNEAGSLAPDRVGAWLDPELDDPAEVRSLQHSPAAGLTVRPVATTVNSVHNNGLELLAEVEYPLLGTAGEHFA
ncbi:hypothetical protein ACFZDG_19490 [Kitasatospora xanthocidica]|uniref:hypothetical protein n=1 Tax=Kitasatospora xanthocidica TaxID=83382 RepID=UPI0036E6305A